MSVEAWNKVIGLPLRARDKFVLLMLAEIANQDGEGTISVSSIAQRTGMTPQKVVRALDSLNKTSGVASAISTREFKVTFALRK